MFQDRSAAGAQLAHAIDGLLRERSWPSSNVVVLGLPRGGLVVAATVARILGTPLDIIVVRKVGLTADREIGIGAVGEEGVEEIDRSLARSLGESDSDLCAELSRQRLLVDARTASMRAVAPKLDLLGRIAVLVDDGVASGHTARVACRIARSRMASRVVMAVPVAPKGWKDGFAMEVDAVVVLDAPSTFRAVGSAYVDFGVVTDAEVGSLLIRSREERHRASES